MCIRDSLQGDEPEGMDVTVVEQRKDILVDQALFAKWVGGVYDGQLNGVVAGTLDDFLKRQSSAADGAAEGEETPFAERAWPVLLREVREAVRAAEVARELARDPAVPAETPPLPEEPVPAHLLRDWDLATWLRTLCPKFEGAMDDVLDVLLSLIHI